MIHSVMAQHFAPPDIPAESHGVRGFLNATTFGLAPAIEDLGAAAGPDYQQTSTDARRCPWWSARPRCCTATSLAIPTIRCARITKQGRQAAEETEKQAGKSWAYTGGQVVWLRCSPPVPGLGAAGGLGARLARVVPPLVRLAAAARTAPAGAISSGMSASLASARKPPSARGSLAVLLAACLVVCSAHVCAAPNCRSTYKPPRPPRAPEQASAGRSRVAQSDHSSSDDAHCRKPAPGRS